MTRHILKIDVDLVRNLPFILDAVLELGLGLFILLRLRPDMTVLIIGWGFICIGIIQVIRKIKTFHLTGTELIIKRPLFPFALGEDRFDISKVKEIKFVRVRGQFGGPHLNVETADRAESFRIETTKEQIDEFETSLRSLGVQTIRDGM